jgi:hypothetical protein
MSSADLILEWPILLAKMLCLEPPFANIGVPVAIGVMWWYLNNCNSSVIFHLTTARRHEESGENKSRIETKVYAKDNHPDQRKRVLVGRVRQKC